MYSIVLTDGKIVNINATEVEWCEKSRMAILYYYGITVARINMNSVVGWINTDYKVESEEQNNERI